MFVLKAETRNKNLKPKQLRRIGIIPGVLYGKDLKESLSIQLSRREAENFLKSEFAGKKVELQVADKKFSALLKEASYDPVSKYIQHLSFQTLRDDEPVTTTMKVVLLNKNKINGIVQMPHPEITYRALPACLVDTVEINLEGLKVGDSIKISDLEIVNNPDIEILDPLDTVLLNIIEAHMADAETEIKGENEEEQNEKKAS